MRKPLTHFAGSRSALSLCSFSGFDPRACCPSRADTSAWSTEYSPARSRYRATDCPCRKRCTAPTQLATRRTQRNELRSGRGERCAAYPGGGPLEVLRGCPRRPELLPRGVPRENYWPHRAERRREEHPARPTRRGRATRLREGPLRRSRCNEEARLAAGAPRTRANLPGIAAPWPHDGPREHAYRCDGHERGDIY